MNAEQIAQKLTFLRDTYISASEERHLRDGGGELLVEHIDKAIRNLKKVSEDVFTHQPLPSADSPIEILQLIEELSDCLTDNLNLSDFENVHNAKLAILEFIREEEKINHSALMNTIGLDE